MQASRSKTFFKCCTGKVGVAEVRGAVSMFIAGLESDGVPGPFDALEVRIRPEEAQEGLLTAWENAGEPYKLVLDEGVFAGRFHCELAQVQD